MKKNRKQNILIADDHPIVRTGLRQIINEEKNLNVSGEASNGIEVLKELKRPIHDLLILDISMPGESGLDILKQIRYSNNKIKVLILSTYSDEIYAERSIKAGADGYLNKQYATRDLIIAINKILNGGKYINPKTAEAIAFGFGMENDLPLHKKLSDREFQVLSLIGNGKTISEISKILMLSVKTVSTYRGRILEKMSLSTTTDLIKYAIKNNLSE